ncbi:MAG: hypothetical protein ACE5JP_17040, partial [Candidatus Bipolaricaulia bacterium]
MNYNTALAVTLTVCAVVLVIPTGVVGQQPQLSPPGSVVEHGLLTVELDAGTQAARVSQVFLEVVSGPRTIEFVMNRSMGMGGIYSVTIPRRFVVQPAVRYFAAVQFTDGTLIRLPAGQELVETRVLEDRSPPRFALAFPKPRDIVIREPLNFIFAVEDNTGGVVPNSVAVTVDGQTPANLRVSERSILFSHKFAETGPHVIEIRGEDFNGQAATQRFRIQARRRFRPQFSGGFEAKTSYGSTTAGQTTPEFSATTGLDASFSFGPFSISGFGSLDLSDPTFTGQPDQPLNRYGAEMEFDTLLLDTQLNAGYFTPSISDFTLDGLEINGYGAELGLLTLLDLKVAYGVSQVGIVADDQLTAAERRVLAVEPSVNLFNVLDFGVGFSSITDHDSPTLFQTRAVTPEANYVIHPHIGLNLGRFSLRTDLALSLHFTDVTSYLTVAGIDALAATLGLDAQQTALLKSYLTAEVLDILKLPDITDPALALQLLTAPDLALGINLELPLLIANATVDYLLAGDRFQALGGESPRDTNELTIELETERLNFLGVSQIVAEYGISEDTVSILDLIGSGTLAGFIPGAQPGESLDPDKAFEEHYGLLAEIELDQITIAPFIVYDLFYDIPLTTVPLFSTSLCQGQTGSFTCESVTDIGVEVDLAPYSFGYTRRNTHTEDSDAPDPILDESTNIFEIGVRTGTFRITLTLEPGEELDIGFQVGDLSVDVSQETDLSSYGLGYRIGAFSAKTRLDQTTGNPVEIGKIEIGYNLQPSPASRLGIAISWTDALLVSASYE